MIDPKLHENNPGNLQGEVAIASAKKAYEMYKDIFSSERFKKTGRKRGETSAIVMSKHQY